MAASQAAEGAASTAVPRPPAGAAAKAPTSVTLWHSYRAHEQNALEQLVKEFNASDVSHKELEQIYLEQMTEFTWCSHCRKEIKKLAVQPGSRRAGVDEQALVAVAFQGLDSPKSLQEQACRPQFFLPVS